VLAPKFCSDQISIAPNAKDSAIDAGEAERPNGNSASVDLHENRLQHILPLGAGNSYGAAESFRCFRAAALSRSARSCCAEARREAASV